MTEPHHDEDDVSAERREFLKKLAAAGALGAGYWAFGGVPEALAAPAWRRPFEALSRRAGAVAAANRPINMVCLGDSIMWGQGLADSQKFQTIVENWVRGTNGQRRPTRRWNFAHSGATLGDPLGGTVVGRNSAAAMGALIRTNRMPREGEEVPDMDSLWNRSSAVTVTEGPPRREPSQMDLMGGEIPRAYPSLWRQLDRAVITITNAKGAAKAPRVQTGEVDLVLLSGGANDVGFVEAALEGGTPADVTRKLQSVIRPRMRAFLPKVLETFPNATIVITGYYRGITPRSTAAGLSGLATYAQQVIGPLVTAIVNGQFVQPFVLEMIARMEAFEITSNTIYQEIAAELGQGRTIFVSPAMAPEHGYGAPASMLFHYEQTDPAERVRREECDALFRDWAAAMFINGAPGAQYDRAPHMACIDASTFHPNVQGARRYADRITAALKAHSPAWLAAPVVVAGGGGPALKPLRLDVKGTTRGVTKTVTVVAFDAATGQQVPGTVSINGAVAATGTPVQFTACTAGGEAAPGPRGKPLPTPRVPCSGTVTAAGYATADFTY